MKIREQLTLQDPAAVVERLVTFLRQQVLAQHRDGAILGLSGGVDSALDAFLAVQALGPDRVSLLFLPELDSSPQSAVDARRITAALHVPLQTVNMTRLLRATGAYRLVPPGHLFPVSVRERYVERRYRTLMGEEPSTFLRALRGGDGLAELRQGSAYLHIKHRLRMVLWYYWAELRNQLVIGNCNLTEKMTGYFIRYGDGGSDVDPLAGLYKTQVWQLARFMGVPEEVVRKAPSPDVAPGMTDEFALQIRYELLDQILWGLLHALSPTTIAQESGATSGEISYVQELLQLSAPMRELPPMPDLTGLTS